MKIKKFLFFILFIFTLKSIFINFYITHANIYIEQHIFNHKIKAIWYDTSSKIYDLKVVATDTQTQLKKLLEQNNSITWLNWVFFCPSDYSWCETKTWYTRNERYIKWKKVEETYHTEDRTVFAWDRNYNPFLFNNVDINTDKENDIYYWLWNFPLLLKNWENSLEYYEKNNLIFDKLKKSSTKTFICSNEEKTHIYFWIVSNATIYELPEILSFFWCYDALNLDAGLSTAFVYNNENLIKPWRPILDWVRIEIKNTNLKEIKKNALQATLKLLEKEISTNNKYKLKKKIKKLKKILDSKKNNIQDKYKKDITRKNIVWFEDVVWFEINIDNKKDIVKIIFLNYIKEYLNIIDLKLE